jgi:hypothetical protein
MAEGGSALVYDVGAPVLEAVCIFLTLSFAVIINNNIVRNLDLLHLATLKI